MKRRISKKQWEWMHKGFAQLKHITVKFNKVDLTVHFYLSYFFTQLYIKTTSHNLNLLK